MSLVVEVAFRVCVVSCLQRQSIAVVHKSRERMRTNIHYYCWLST